MKTADTPVVAAAVVVAAAALLGGVFDPLPRLFVGGLLVVVVGVLIGSRQTRLTGDEWVAFAVIAWGAISAVASRGAPLAAREEITVWVVALCLWIAARRAGAAARQWALAVILGATVMLVFGVVFEAVGMQGLRVGGFLENPNLTASLVVVGLPVLLVLSGTLGPRLRVVIAAVLASGIALTGSRAGMLAVLITAAVLLPKGRARSFGLALGSLGIAVVLVWRFLSQPDVLAWYRPAIWRAVLQVWMDHPFAGVGPGGLADAAGPARLLHADHVGQHQFLVTYAESSPLGLLVQTGAVGLLLAAIAAFLWLRKGKADGGALSNPPLRALVAGIIVVALFHDLWSADVVLWWWALTVGLVEAAARPAETLEPKPAHISHQLPAADGDAPHPAVFSRLGVLDVLSSTAPRPEGRKHHWARRLAALATEPGEVCGLAHAGPRVVLALAGALLVLWGIVGPAWARTLWQSGETNMRRMERAIRAEPWLDVPLRWQTRDLLRAESWSWEEASEALTRSRRAVRIHPGAARLWADLGLVHARVVTDLGLWPDSVEGARTAFARAAELEPLLPWHWLEWARFERTMGRREEALALAHRALAAEPHTVRAWLLVARLELDHGRIDAAGRALSSARASADLRRRTGLNAYERELLAGPGWQIRELEEELR